MISSNYQILIVIIIGIIIIFLFYNSSENFTTTPSSTTSLLATEACQNVASVYNAENLTASNIIGTKFINSKGNIDASGNINSNANIGAIGNVNAGNAYVVGPSTNQWIINPGLNGEQKLLSIAPMLPNGSPDINNNFVLQSNGNNIWTNKNITTTGNLNVSGTITSLGNGVPIVLKSESGKELLLQARDSGYPYNTVLQVMSPPFRTYRNFVMDAVY
jgi:hypothetical protein